MHTAIARLKSVSPYSQSRAHQSEKLDKESHDAYEKRTWRNRLHCDKDERVYIPPMAFKICIAEAAKFLSEKIPGKRNATWTKHFEAGVLVTEPVPLGIHREDVRGEWLYLHANGVRGSGTRVMRCMPMLDQWEADVTFHVLDDTITEDVFRHHLVQAGSFIGIGRFRPRQGGFLGRFSVESLDWS